MRFKTELWDIPMIRNREMKKQGQRELKRNSQYVRRKKSGTEMTFQVNWCLDSVAVFLHEFHLMEIYLLTDCFTSAVLEKQFWGMYAEPSSGGPCIWVRKTVNRVVQRWRRGDGLERDLKRNLAISGDIFVCHNWGRDTTYFNKWRPAKHSTAIGISPYHPNRELLDFKCQ